MLELAELYQIQVENNVTSYGSNIIDEEYPFKDYLALARTFADSNRPSDYYKFDTKSKTEHVQKSISTFVATHEVRVTGYTRPDGITDKLKLEEDLIDAITGFAILKAPLDGDNEVDEIQINDHKTIFVIKGGVAEYLEDEEGNPLQFESDDEVNIILNRLIDDPESGNTPQFTEGSPLLNEKTHLHNYRVSATHHSINARDKPPFNFNVTTVTIRKFKPARLTVDDIQQTGAFPEQIGKFLKLVGRADVRFFCVGGTGSGKTTLLNAICLSIPLDYRIILTQNPSEILYFERDEYGRNLRNVLHWEVTSKASLDELIAHTLRNTPDLIIVGESREPSEFEQTLRVLKTGHSAAGSFHAESVKGGLSRFADEVASASGGISSFEALKMVCDSVDLMIIQKRYRNGDRKIIEIGEVIDADTQGNANIRILFTFRLNGKTTVDDKGRMRIGGSFYQTANMSENLIEKFYSAGVTHDELEEFLETVPEEGRLVA